MKNYESSLSGGDFSVDNKSKIVYSEYIQYSNIHNKGKSIWTLLSVTSQVCHFMSR